ncbi:Heterokaryon incompatibility protein 6, OR allele [Fusarium oxysporum f. sp. albedinis]|nr:Heterokaryon incompatibility protein 6, OR allele [Fusarium oxysporum f. sp. albedinis]
MQVQLQDKLSDHFRDAENQVASVLQASAVLLGSNKEDVFIMQGRRPLSKAPSPTWTKRTSSDSSRQTKCIDNA